MLAPISPNSYQDFTGTTAFYDQSAVETIENLEYTELCNFLSLCYVAGKLNGESGEIAEEVFKAMRDDYGVITEERSEKILKELGDAQYYIARIAKHLGYTLEQVMEVNIEKLKNRQVRGKLGGSGDVR